MVDGNLEILAQLASVLGRVAPDIRQVLGHDLRALEGGHPAVAEPRHAAQPALAVARLIGPRVRRDQDRHRLLHGLRLDQDVLEADVFALVGSRLAAGEQAHHLDRLFHPPHPRARRDAEGVVLAGDGIVVVRGRRAHAGAEHHPPARQRIQRRPLMRQQQRRPQRRRGEAGRPDPHPRGDAGHRRHQRKRIQPRLRQQRIADPHPVPPHIRIRPPRKVEHRLNGRPPRHDPPIGKRQPQLHGHSAPPARRLSDSYSGHLDPQWAHAAINSTPFCRSSTRFDRFPATHTRIRCRH